MSLRFDLTHRNIVMVPTMDLFIWVSREYFPNNPTKDLSKMLTEFGLKKMVEGYEEGYTNLKVVSREKFAFSIIKYGFQVR